MRVNSHDFKQFREINSISKLISRKFYSTEYGVSFSLDHCAQVIWRIFRGIVSSNYLHSIWRKILSCMHFFKVLIAIRFHEIFSKRILPFLSMFHAIWRILQWIDFFRFLCIRIHYFRFFSYQFNFTNFCWINQILNLEQLFILDTTSLHRFHVIWLLIIPTFLNCKNEMGPTDSYSSETISKIITCIRKSKISF